jgi:membrane protease YdiL (CAAX protease family)
MSDQPPLVWLALLVVTGAFGAIAIVGPLVWFHVGWRLYHRQAVLPQEPRRLASWGLIDLIGIVALVTVITIALVLGMQVVAAINMKAAALGDDNQGRLYLMLLGSLGQMLASALVGGFIILRTGCSLRDLGFSARDFGSDLRLGAAAFCALAIPTFAIQGVLTRFWPSAHPLIESLKADKDPQFLAIALFAAVIAAPLTEEFIFRVLFQGWLEKMFDPDAIFRPNFVPRLFAGERVPAAVVEPPAEVIQAVLAEPEQPRSIFLGPPPLDYPGSLNPYYAPNSVAAPETSGPPPQAVNFPHWITDVVPITACAAVFALMHWSHGPDFIPLFFLALGLGYLYRRTHRITPGLVVHFLLNLVSMLALCAAIYGEGLPQ